MSSGYIAPDGRELRAECDLIDTDNGIYVQFLPGARHFYIDGVEVSYEEAQAFIAANIAGEPHPVTAKPPLRVLAARCRASGDIAARPGQANDLYDIAEWIDAWAVRVSELEAAARTPEDDAVLAAAELLVEQQLPYRLGDLPEAVRARREALGASQ